MKKYVYFISYNAEVEEKWRGKTITGNTSVETDRKIEDIESIREIEKCVCEKFGYSNVVITNYILLREEEEA